MTAATGDDQPTGGPAEPTERPLLTGRPPSEFKKQAPYRLDIEVCTGIQLASIYYSARQGRRYSQNQIVDTALRDWLDRNGPFGPEEHAGQHEPSPPDASPADPTKLTGRTPSEFKKQVGFRLDIEVLAAIELASIYYSARQGRRYSQNQIVDTALRDWLDRNGPWG